MTESREKTDALNPASRKPVISAYIGRIIDALFEIIIPPGGKIPFSVDDTKARSFLENYIADMDGGARTGIKLLLIAFDILPFLFIFRFSRFVNLSNEDKERYLMNWNDSRIYYRRMVVVLLKTLLGMGFYNDAKVLSAIGFKLKCKGAER